MSYIGNSPEIGTKKLLSLSGSTPATSYTLQHNSQNYETETQSILLSINGVVQAMDGTAYTVSGSTIDFLGVSVASGDVDFIITTGEKIDISNVTDGTIDTSSLSTNFILENNNTYGDVTIPANKRSMIVGEVSITGTLTVGANAVLVII